MTTEQIHEHIMEQHNEMYREHPELALNKDIDGFIEKAKREGAMEVLKEVRELYMADDRYAALERRIKKKYGVTK